MRTPNTSKNKLQSNKTGFKDLKSLQKLVESAGAIVSSDGATQFTTPCSIHDSNGSILYISNSAKRILGQDLSSADEPNIIKHIHVQDRVSVAHYLANCATMIGENTIFRTLPRTSLQTYIIDQEELLPQADWVQLSCFNLEPLKSGERYYMALYQDVSDFKKLENELACVREETEAASIAKSRFLANISHELRTPLNAILGFSDLLNSPLIEAVSVEKKAEYTGLIHNSAEHLLCVLNDILDVSKIETGLYEIFPESFSVSKCLTNTVAIMFGEAQKKSIKLEGIGFDELPEVIADERAIRQILINLIANAIKFSNPDSNVKVTASRLARTIKIVIEDNGIGISSENLENLGKPFFQADSKYDRKFEGTGLGLSVVKGLVELHQGTLDIKSKRNVGTIVTVNIPIHGSVGRHVPAPDKIEKITKIDASEENLEGKLRIVNGSV